MAARPATALYQSMAQPALIAGLELGGTKCIAILGSGPDVVHASETLPTTDPETTLSGLEAILDGWTFDALGVTAFGPLMDGPQGGRISADIARWAAGDQGCAPIG